MRSTELVHVTAHYFKAGEYPAFSWDIHADADDPESLCNSHWLWWIDPESPNRSIDLCLTSEAPYTLTCDVVRIDITPLQTEVSSVPGAIIGLIANDIDNLSVADTFDADEYAPFFKELADKIRDDQPVGSVSFITVWSCWSDRDYFGDWDSGFDYLGWLRVENSNVVMEMDA